MNLNIKILGIDIGSILVEALIYTACFLTLINIKLFIKKKNIQSIIKVIVSMIVILFVAFPTARARFISGTVYLGIFLFFKKTFKNKNTFKIVFVTLFLIIMPYLSSVRYNTSISDGLQNFILVNPYEYLIKGDSTAYIMGLSGIQYLNENDLLYGKQMISNILFFIPRSIWPEKMVSLGSWLAEYNNHSHYNMDSPLFIEFFIDFGYIGLVVFTSITAFICSKLDYKFWNICMKSDSNYLLKYLYPFILILFFFINRGAFMSTFPRLVNLLLGFLLARILYKNYKIKILDNMNCML